jgi:hypothetical protein
MRSSFFWDLRQHLLLFSYGCFRMACRSHLQGSRTAWPFKIGPTGYSETSVTNYRWRLLNVPEVWRSYLFSASSLSALSLPCHLFPCYLWSLLGSILFSDMDAPSFHNSKAFSPQAFAETILFLWSSLLPKKYGVIHKSVRHFRPLRYSSQGGHGEGEHISR